MAFDNPARRSFVVEMVPPERHQQRRQPQQRADDLVAGGRSGARRPARVTVGFGWAFLGDGLSYLAVLAGLWMMRTDELRPPPVTPRGRGQVRAGLRYVRSEPELCVPLAMMAVVGTLSYNFQTVFPLFVTRDLDGSDATFTVLFSVVSVGLAGRRAGHAPGAATSACGRVGSPPSPTAWPWR